MNDGTNRKQKNSAVQNDRSKKMVSLNGLKPVRIKEVRSWKDKRDADLISDVLLFGRLLYGEP